MHTATLSWTEILARLGLALVLGSIVGLERERGERAAGLRTHALVCIGAALIMLVSAYGLNGVVNGKSVIVDPSRIAAQVVSGIGFLGAGTIFLRRDIVRGLTTAAGIWVVAGIGLAAGAGLYFTALAGTAGALLILAALQPLERRLFPRAQRILLHVRPQEGQLSAIRHAMRRSGIRLRRLSLQAGLGSGEETITLDCAPAPLGRVEQLVELLHSVPGLVGVDMVAPSPSSESQELGDDDDENQDG
jgi:putative Mg2+ transporter-C (MgtC) family protein